MSKWGLAVLLGGIIAGACLVGAVPAAWNSPIVLTIRLPRVLLGALIGMLLSTSGAILQGVLRNPLADPYILGVSSGAAVGAAVGFTFPALGFIYIPFFAFSGALLAVFIVYKLAAVGSKILPETLILAGVALSMFLAAILALMVIFGKSIYPIYYWLLGGLSGASWQSVWMIAPYAVTGYLLTLIFRRDLNVLLLGDESALALGVDVPRVRIILLALASLLAAAAVSVSGIIGFVGLMVPHLARMWGGGDYCNLLPVSALLGAILLVLADLGARTIFSPVEIPIGIITALLGVPFFIWVLRSKKC